MIWGTYTCAFILCLLLQLVSIIIRLEKYAEKHKTNYHSQVIADKQTCMSAVLWSLSKLRG